MLYSHLSERSDRRLVLAEGRSATAVMSDPGDFIFLPGFEYVAVIWSSESVQRQGKVWTGERFARELRERGPEAAPRVGIKYVSDTPVSRR